MISRERGVTEDAFLGGAVIALQMKTGYRAGLDAVLLASAAPVRAGTGQRVLDVGAGVGIVGLCIAARVADAQVVLLERHPALVALAAQNIARNRLADRVAVVAADVAGPAVAHTAHGLVPGSFDHCVANPPYGVDGRGRRPEDQLKAAAHAMPEDGLETWARVMARLTRPSGTATVIHRADALAALIAALAPRFGALTVVPVHAKAEAPAIRVIAHGIKGSRAPISILPPIVLHDKDGLYRPEIEAVLRAPAPLDRGA